MTKSKKDFILPLNSSNRTREWTCAMHIQNRFQFSTGSTCEATGNKKKKKNKRRAFQGTNNDRRQMVNEWMNGEIEKRLLLFLLGSWIAFFSSFGRNRDLTENGCERKHVDDSGMFSSINWLRLRILENRTDFFFFFAYLSFAFLFVFFYPREKSAKTDIRRREGNEITFSEKIVRTYQMINIEVCYQRNRILRSSSLSSNKMSCHLYSLYFEKRECNPRRNPFKYVIFFFSITRGKSRYPYIDISQLKRLH